MKLSFTTYDIAKKLTLDENIALAKVAGCAGIEFRTDMKAAHGVETSLDAAGRKAVRRKMEDNYLETVCITTGYQFHMLDDEARAQQVEGAKKACDLAYDLGCTRIRVFGNLIEGDAQQCVERVSKALGEVADYAAPLGIDVLLEMHQDFNFWGYALPAIRMAARPNLHINYNCDPRDVIAGHITETFSRIAPYVNHVHLHNLDDGYPYLELFEQLARRDYQGYVSFEFEGSSDPFGIMKLSGHYFRLLRECAYKNVR
nr:sugar phosphate isomerase/epimerase [bacterium]